MDEFPDSTCACCREGFADQPRSDVAVICLVCQEPCNLVACVARNRVDAEDLSETLVEGRAQGIWQPVPRSRSELPRASD
jgi:hypothetical protein